MQKIAIAATITLGCFAFSSGANADPYQWCAQYGGRGGVENCYFVTRAQCQAALDGPSAFCRPNTFYTGPSSRRGR